MSITSSRTVQIQYSGDVFQQVIQSALDNLTAMGVDNLVTLSSGANTITPPSVSGLTIIGVTIIPPAGNTTLITLKGVTGDTGIPIHKTDPTSLGLNTTLTTFVLTAAAQVNGVRLVWT